MVVPRLEDHGLSEAIVEDIRARERRQLELFVRVTGTGAAILWAVLTVFVYSHSARHSPALGLVFAPLLALAGAVIGTLPLAILCGAGLLLLYRRHPRADDLERYEAATAHVRTCDVCVLARGDHEIKEGVAHCSRCGAWLCPACRSRYDLRAIAALRARRGPDPG